MPVLGLHRNVVVSQVIPQQWNFNGPIDVITLERDANGLATGKLYVGGGFTRYNGTAVNPIVRLNPNGTIDTSFNTGREFGGTVATIVPVSGSTSIYVGGFFAQYSGSDASFVARINSNGTLDTTFNPGTLTVSQPGVTSIALESGSSRLYIGGDFTAYSGSSRNRIVRVNSNGTLDNTFNIGLGAYHSVANTPNAVLGILPVTQSAGEVYIVGSFTFYSGSGVNGIARINSNGTLVGTSSFNPGVGNATGFNSAARVIRQAFNSTAIYVGGSFSTYSGSSVTRVVRINANGTRDTNFNPGTGFNIGTFIDSIADTLDGSGDIYVGGRFTSYSGSSTNNIVRLRTNGTISESFGTGFNAGVFTIAPTSSGEVYMGGNFTAYKGNTYNYIIKLIS